MITTETVLAVQREVLKLGGGLSTAPTDAQIAALSSALVRVENRISFGVIQDFVEIAVWYAAAISRGHCFPDANKRTAYAILNLFLEANGASIIHSSLEQCEDKIVELASGELEPESLIAWVRENLTSSHHQA